MVEDRVKNHKHTDRHKLFAEVENVIADKAVVCVQIDLLCKGVERAVCKQLNGKGDFSCFRFILF